MVEWWHADPRSALFRQPARAPRAVIARRRASARFSPGQLMGRSEQQERRLLVLSRYQEYVAALQTYHLDPSADEVRHTRGALARAIELACAEDPDLLGDFKRAFASRPLS